MNLSLLNVDVLSHLINFVKPVDRFNLVLSGILKGFENVKGIDLSKRYSEHFTFVSSCNQIVINLLRVDYFGIELGLRRGSTCELEIRSGFQA
jgi:hypothetical protein